MTGCSWFARPTISGIYLEYEQLAIDFQYNHYLLMTSVYPELKEVAAAERDEQILRRKRRTQRFMFLLQNQPDKLTLDKGIMAMTNFDWNDQLEQRLIEADPDYARISSQLRQKIAENRKNALTLEQREKIKNVFYRPEYIQLLKDMQKQVDKIDEKLKAVVNAGQSVCLK